MGSRPESELLQEIETLRQALQAREQARQDRPCPGEIPKRPVDTETERALPLPVQLAELMAEGRYRLLWDLIDEGVAINEAVFDENGDIVDYIVQEVNPAFEKQSSYPAETAVGKRATDLYQLSPEYIRDWWRGHSALARAEYTELYHEPTRRWQAVTATRMAGNRFVTIFSNITKRKQAEAALRESEARYKSLFENNPAVMLITDPDSGAIVDANPAACAYYGWCRDELLQRPIYEINTLSRSALQPVAASALAGERNHFFIQHRRADGTLRDVDVYNGPIALQGQTLLYSIIHDITERQLVEKALQESEARYRRIFETTAEGIWAMDRDHRTTFVNERLAAMLGYQPADMIGKPVEAFMLEEDLPAHQSRMAQRQIGLGGSYEHRFRRRDGTLLWTNVSATVLTTAQGDFDGSYAMVTDITERKQTDEALRKSELRYKQLFDAIPESVLLIGIDRCVVAANQASARLYGYESPQQLEGLDTRLLIAEKERERAAQSIAREPAKTAGAHRLTDRPGQRECA